MRVFLVKHCDEALEEIEPYLNSEKVYNLFSDHPTLVDGDGRRRFWQRLREDPDRTVIRLGGEYTIIIREVE